jgi:hypothetical protein
MLFAATAALAAALGMAPCAGADLGIKNVKVTGVTNADHINTYTLGGTVVNAGSTNQAGNVLQSVSVNRDGVKTDEHGVPPLKIGQNYRFATKIQRSDEAGNGTTQVQLVLQDKRAAAGAPACSVVKTSL